MITPTYQGDILDKPREECGVFGIYAANDGLNVAGCAMEYIYFARPDSVIDGRSVHAICKELGRELARMYPIDADVVVPVPDSGYSMAIGFAAEAGLPLDFGLVANRYVGHTFSEPEWELRRKSVVPRTRSRRSGGTSTLTACATSHPRVSSARWDSAKASSAWLVLPVTTRAPIPYPSPETSGEG